MLAVFRRHLSSWVARLFFLLLIGTFVLWGVGDVIRNMGAGDGSVATVAGRKIGLPVVQEAYRRQLAQVTRMFGGKIDPTPQMRRGIAAQAIEQIVTQTALTRRGQRHGARRAGCSPAAGGVRHPGLPRGERPVRPERVRLRCCAATG